MEPRRTFKIQHRNPSNSIPHILPEQLYITFDDFILESGERLQDATVAFTIKGHLNAQRTNAVVVCHALSGNAEVEDWWSSIMGRHDSELDTGSVCIICCNVLGSPYGSTSALSVTPNGTFCYGSSFPKTTVRDDARIQNRLFDALGLKSLYCVIGASMGGMLVLELAAHFGKEYVQSLVLISTAARSSPWVIGMAETQRSSIKSDAKWRGGSYGDDPPTDGLAAASMLAMLSYRTHASFEKRFGRDQMNMKRLSSTPGIVDGEQSQPKVFVAQSYLWYQGEKFNRRFDANCYLHILDKIDSHDISRGRCPGQTPSEAIKTVLAGLHQPALVVGIASDLLYPLEEQVTLAENMPYAVFELLESEDGHDGFLLEGEQMNKLLHKFFGRKLVDGMVLLEKDSADCETGQPKGSVECNEPVRHRARRTPSIATPTAGADEMHRPKNSSISRTTCTPDIDGSPLAESRHTTACNQRRPSPRSSCALLVGHISEWDG